MVQLLLQKVKDFPWILQLLISRPGDEAFKILGKLRGDHRMLLQWKDLDQMVNMLTRGNVQRIENQIHLTYWLMASL